MSVEFAYRPFITIWAAIAGVAAFTIFSVGGLQRVARQTTGLPPPEGLQALRRTYREEDLDVFVQAAGGDTTDPAQRALLGRALYRRLLWIDLAFVGTFGTALVLVVDGTWLRAWPHRGALWLLAPLGFAFADLLEDVLLLTALTESPQGQSFVWPKAVVNVAGRVTQLKWLLLAVSMVLVLCGAGALTLRGGA